jgi:hypothetical protein
MQQLAAFCHVPPKFKSKKAAGWLCQLWWSNDVSVVKMITTPFCMLSIPCCPQNPFADLG